MLHEVLTYSVLISAGAIEVDQVDLSYAYVKYRLHVCLRMWLSTPIQRIKCGP